MAHVKELLEKLNAAGVVASLGHEEEGAGEWEDESDGEGEAGDVAMEE